MSARLTDAERRYRALTEADLQRQVTDVLELRGWTWVHFRALRNRRGIWQVPVEGPLGVGWPDIFAVKWDPLVYVPPAIALELKRELAKPTPEQVAVHAALERAGIRARVVRPSDLADPIQESDLWRWLP